MKKTLLFLLLNAMVIIQTQASGMIRMGGDPGYIMGHSADIKAFYKGFSVPISGIYSEIYYNTAFIITLQYSRLTGKSGFDLNWKDPLTSSNKSVRVNTDDTYHTPVFATGFDFTFPFNWQDENRSFLKLFLPYIGLDLNYYFPILNRKTDLQAGVIPDVLYDSYKNQNRFLIPTIGASARIGTRIILSDKAKLNLKIQYSYMIPESTLEKLYLNHYISISLGFEYRIYTPPMAKKGSK